jgi:CheY-like chemotaxis protein
LTPSRLGAVTGLPGTNDSYYFVDGMSVTVGKVYPDLARHSFALVTAIQVRRPGFMAHFRRFSNRILRAVRAQTYANQKVLVVSRESYEVIARLCGRLKLELQYAGSLPAALKNLPRGRFDVVIYDQDMPDEDWRGAVTSLAQASPGSSILLLSTLRQPEIWNEVIRKGGHDILSKPVTEDGAESTIALARARAKVNRMRGSIA